MKKHNEGYSLVLVLVVLTVLSLVASFILSFSLRNLQSQTASVTRMQDEYKAAGEIEKLVAQLEALAEDASTTLKGEEATSTTLKHSLTVSDGTVQIDCVLLLTAKTVTPTGTAGEYTITGPVSVAYTSYEVSSVEPTATEEGGGGQ